MDWWNFKLFNEFKSKGGNAAVNAMYEATLPPEQKPNEACDRYTLEKFLRAKYVDRTWHCQSLIEVRGAKLFHQSSINRRCMVMTYCISHTSLTHA